MRIRTVKPEFFVHEGLYEAEVVSNLPLRLAFIGLWCAADREGRFKWEPRRLGVQILPYDQVDFSRVLDALATRGYVVKYASEGVDFGAIPSFLKHQIVNNRERPSELPEPIFHKASDACPTRAPREDHACKAEGKGKEGKGKEQGKDIAPPAGAVHEPALADDQKDLELESESPHSHPSGPKPKSASTNTAKAKAETPDQVEEFALSIGATRGQGTAWFWKMEGQGWINGKKLVKDWKATVRSHHMQGYLPMMDPTRPIIPMMATAQPQVEPTFATWEDSLRDQGLDEEAIERRRRVVSMSAPEPIIDRSKATA